MVNSKLLSYIFILVEGKLMKRIGKGIYQSDDGRVEIKRVHSHNNHRADDVCWEVTIDGEVQVYCWDTKQEAVYHAEKLLKERAKP